MIIRNVLLFKIIAPLVLTLSFTTPAFADELKDIAQMSENGQQAAALDRINTYLAANPRDAQAMFMKGIILAESGKRDDAIKSFTELTEKYPNLPEPYNNLAVLYAEASQYDKAKKALETAIKTHPSYATAHENLGDIYARMASEAYDKALQLDSGNARAQSKLAMIKDLFSTGGKSATAAKTEPAKTIVATKTEPTKTAEPMKPSKTGTMPIRPADKKVEPPKPAEPMVSEEQNITDTVNAWAKAWSSQDLDKYFASYAESFIPAKGQSHKDWEKTRRERISRPSSINVDIANLNITMDGTENAKASFKQSYRADGKPIRTDKTLLLKKTNGSWLIEQEIASN
jgi:tetratricopeptide (TPR) repeat protein